MKTDRSLRLVLAVSFVAAGCLVTTTPAAPAAATAPTAMKIVPPASGMYLGAYEWRDGQTSGLAAFEQAVGAKVAFAPRIKNTFGCKDSSGSEGNLPYFDAAAHERAYQAGYLTYFSVEFCIDPNQPGYAADNPQAIIDGKLDEQLRQIATAIKQWGRPLFFGYQREPAIGGLSGRTSGYGYGKDGLQDYATTTDKWGQYKGGNNTQGDRNCLDGIERYRDSCRYIHDFVERIAPGQVTWVMGAVAASCYMADYPEPGAVLIYVCDPENPEAGGMHLALSLTRSNLILLRDTASNALGSERS